MADPLSSAAWAAGKRRQKLSLDDDALVKALAGWEKLPSDRHADRLDALGGLIAQVDRQIVALARRRKELGDKPFAGAKDLLHGLREAAERRQAETRQALADAERAAAEEAAPPPALLTKKMLPLLRELRKGRVRMHAMICTAGRNTALLIQAKPIAPARRKLLAEAVDAAGGARFHLAECGLEDGVLTFALRSSVSGMDKRLKAALLAQTGLRLAVKVRVATPADATGGAR